MPTTITAWQMLCWFVYTICAGAGWALGARLISKLLG